MSERFYRLLLRCYPRAFRERYEQEMLRVFRDRLRDERTLGVWMDVLVDALVSIPQQHLTVIGSRVPFPRSAAPFYAKTFGGAVAGGMSLGVLFAASIVAAFFVQNGWLLTVVMAVVSIAVIWTGERRVRHIRKRYRAEADHDSVTVTCAPVGITPLTLSRSDVTALQLVEPLGFRIHAADPARDLWVPFGSPDYEAAKLRLSQWAPLKVTSLGAALINADTFWHVPIACLACGFGPISPPLNYLAGICALGALSQRSISRFVLFLVPAAIVLARRFL